MKMYAKVLISLLATALLPLLVVTLITYRSSQATLLATAGVSLEANAQALSSAALLLVEDANAEVASWATLETLQNVFTGEDTLDLRMTLLLRSLQADSHFLEIYCTDVDGQVVAASDAEPGSVRFAHEATLQQALAGRPAVSPMITVADPGGTTHEAVAIAYPLMGAWDGTTVIGAIIAFYDWRLVSQRVAFHERTTTEPGTFLFLADGSGRLVAQGQAPEAHRALLGDELPALGTGVAPRSHDVSRARLDGSRQLIAYATLKGSQPEIAFSGIAMAPESFVLAPARRLAWRTLLACAIAALAIVALALFLSRRISGPLAVLSATAREIAEGNLESRPPRLGGHEIGRLAADLDTMRQSLKHQIETLDEAVRERTRQLEASVEELQREIRMREQAEHEARLREQQLRQADKMVSLGILVSGVAHEINNPNGLIALNIGLLSEAWAKAVPALDRYQAEYGDFSLGVMNYSEFRDQLPLLLADTAAGSERIRAIVDDLKGFSRPADERMREEVVLNAVAESAVNMVGSHLKKATRNFSMALEEGLPAIRGSARRLEQVLVNLLLNACVALESDEAAIRLVSRTGDQGEAILEVRDAGRGIAPEDLPRVTDPFFTTRRTAGGTGLGLFVSAGIIEEHGGVMEFESTPGKGTTVRITFSQNDQDSQRDDRTTSD